MTTTKATYPVGVAKCRQKCAGRRTCICDGNHAHVHHICEKENCVCHSAAAFGLVKSVRRNGEEVYEGAPATLEMRP